MQVLVSGILIDPMGTPLPNVDIRITTKGSDGSVLPHTCQTHTTGLDGSYSFDLLYGTYYAEVLMHTKHQLAGDLRVDESTPNPIDLPTLVRYSYPIDATGKPTYPSEWDTLLSVLDNSPLTRKRITRDQIVDEDVHTSDRAETQVNMDHGLRMGRTTRDLAAGQANVNREEMVYADGDGNQLAATGETITTPEGSAVSHTQVDDFETESKQDYKQGSDKSISSTKHIDATTTTYNESMVHSDSSTSLNTKVDSIKVQTTRIEQTAKASRTQALTANQTMISQVLQMLLNTGATQTEILDGLDITATGSSVNHTNTFKDYTCSDMESNTGSYAQRSLKYDNLNVVRLADGLAVFTVDTATGNVRVNGTLTIDTLHDSDGNPIDPKDGDTIFQVSQWSDSPTGPWMNAAEPYHTWRRDNWSINGVIDPADWTGAYRIRGVDGEPGDTFEHDYEYSPDGATNWSKALKAGDKYRRERVLVNGVPGDWSTPALIIGTDGSTVEVRYEYSINGLDNWHPILVPADGFEHRATFIDGVIDGAWSDPYPIGKGDTGITGMPGSGWYTIIDGVGEWPGDTQATIDFIDTFGRAPFLNDHLIYVDLPANPLKQAVKRCSSDRGDPDVVWAAALLIVNGDMIVQGTVSAFHMAAKTITGNQISSATTMIAGIGASTAGMNGSDADNIDDPYDDAWPKSQIPNIYKDIRFWSGAANPASANWKVDKNGRMEALDVLCRGEIRATTGYIENYMTIGQSNDADAGRVRLLSGDAGSTDHAMDIYAGNQPRFVLRHNGQLQMWKANGAEVLNFDPVSGNFTFKGTVHADQIIGDLVSSKVYSVNTTEYFHSPGWKRAYIFTVTNNNTQAASVTFPSINFEVSGSCHDPFSGCTATASWSSRILKNGGVLVSSPTYSISENCASDGCSTAAVSGLRPTLTHATSLAVGETATFEVQYSIGGNYGRAISTSVAPQLFRDGAAFA